MRYGIITVPVTDMRAEPDRRSERLSQALFGAPVMIETVQNECSRIILPDGYCGWCRSGHLDRIPHSAWKQYLAQPRHLIKSVSAKVGDKGGHEPPFRLLFATEVVVAKRAGKTIIRLPNGFSAPINPRQVIPAPAGPTRSVIGRRIVATAREFLGTPYLWGGITPCGFDCSGLVQTVYRFHGIRLPRDSKDQSRAGKPVDRAELRPGDLLFFPGHVAIACGGMDIIHASAGRGMVTINALDRTADNYREDLNSSFREARRVLP
ncbi:MAG: NlpC/P60 family protein [candidate division Zixibacteria bacterium]|nr:NlpC/P60 family protein [candidate division Zixibacteria bacterium]